MLCFVAERLAIRGYSVTIVNLKATNDVTDYKRPINNVNIIALDKADQKGNRHISAINEICRIAKSFKADVLVGFTGFPSFYACVVGKKLHIPSIMSERGDPERTTPKKLKSRLILAIINTSKGGVFQIDGAKAFYGKGLQKRGVVIPNPIFVQGEVPTVDFEAREKTVVSVGRLDNEQKRYDVMINAFKIFSKSHPEYTLKLYGRGTDEKLIEKWVKEAGLSEKVRFMGLSTQPMQDIAKDGMFLITSDYEGISNALLEAMAVGLPCVSTDHTPGGARLLIKDRENGLLAPIGDSEALAKAMCEYAENPALSRKCGENAKSVLVRFAPDRIIDMWEDYINGIC